MKESSLEELMEPPVDQNFNLEMMKGDPNSSWRKSIKAKVDSSLHSVFWEDPAKVWVMLA